jgi:hypothetical protein
LRMTEVHHDPGPGDHERLPFEAAEPRPLAAIIALDPNRSSVAHDQWSGWDHGGIDRPMIGAVACHLPWGQAIDQLLQGYRITTPTLPV